MAGNNNKTKQKLIELGEVVWQQRNLEVKRSERRQVNTKKNKKELTAYNKSGNNVWGERCGICCNVL